MILKIPSDRGRGDNERRMLWPSMRQVGGVLEPRSQLDYWYWMEASSLVQGMWLALYYIVVGDFISALWLKTAFRDDTLLWITTYSALSKHTAVYFIVVINIPACDNIQDQLCNSCFIVDDYAAQYLSRQIVYISIFELQNPVVNSFRYFREILGSFCNTKIKASWS